MALHLKHRVNLHMTFRCPVYVYDNTGVRVIMMEEFMTIQKNHKVSLYMTLHFIHHVSLMDLLMTGSQDSLSVRVSDL